MSLLILMGKIQAWLILTSASEVIFCLCFGSFSSASEVMLWAEIFCNDLHVHTCRHWFAQASEDTTSSEFVFGKRPVAFLQKQIDEREVVYELSKAPVQSLRHSFYD